ncbi:conserved hypothetical protein [uncultured delta proteobacterium]|uniref:Metallo-beta-lactamase domain-containing protein n=1 Tax=uncultured delta proteobacterium TaxID=34034 RepID=A0A212JID4_9DELT|nr:conserved hypothetical protein [uncultured delta proteobacterium]
MRLVVLADNNTLIDNYYMGEPAVCYYIEDGDAKILLDAGYSDLFIKNAHLLGVDLHQVTHVALSHGHNDHSRGLAFLHEHVLPRKIAVVAHPDALAERHDNGTPIGCPLGRAFLEAQYALTLTREPFAFGENLVFLGEIPSYNDFERTKPMGVMRDKNGERDDFVLDDSAMACTCGDGLFIITGCSHSGICNIIEHAKRVCGKEKILGVIGGFHLFEVSEQLTRTIRYFRDNGIDTLYPCHCVSFAAKAEIHKHIPVRDVGVGLEITA